MATQTLRRPEPPSRATLRKQRLLEMENEQRIEDAEALKMTEEQRLSLFHSFRSVKFEWSDLDGMRSVRRRYNSPPVTEVQCHPSSPPSHPSHPQTQSPRAAAHVHSQTHTHSPSHTHNSPSPRSSSILHAHAQGQQPRPPQLQLTPPTATPAFAVLTNAHFDSLGPRSDETIRGISPLSGVATPFPSSPVSAFPPTPLYHPSPSAESAAAFPPTPAYSQFPTTTSSSSPVLLRPKSTSPTSSAGRITKTRSKKVVMGKVGKTRSPVKGLFPPGLGSPTCSAPASTLIYATPLPPLITGASTSALSCGHAGASVVVSPIRVPLPPFLSSDTSHCDPADEDEDAWEDLEGEDEEDGDEDGDGDGEDDEDALPTPVARGWGFEERLEIPTLSYSPVPMRAGTPTPYSVPTYTVSAHGANEEEQVGGKRKR
ncbi:hypothetical protein C8R43DRAFT_986413 [Mycena crocata]|nr:hypothetical protein C8R43DRAFT_986413 [Mycena crocata]